MATYPVKHTETGEEKIVEMSVTQIMKWYEDNPEWKRDWSKGHACPVDEGEWKHKLVNQHPGWRKVLDGVASINGSRARDLY